MDTHFRAFDSKHSRLIERPHLLPPESKTLVLVSETLTETRQILSESGYNVQEVQHPRDISACLQGNLAVCWLVDLDTLNGRLGDLLERVWTFAIGLQVIAISSDPSSSAICQAIRSGATDYCTRPFSHQQLSEAVDRAFARDTGGSPSPMVVRSRLAKLTDREREVVDCCLKGINTKVIAKQLDVTYQTIDKHRKKALRKMEIGSMVELAVLLHQTTLTAMGCRYSFAP